MSDMLWHYAYTQGCNDVANVEIASAINATDVQVSNEIYARSFVSVAGLKKYAVSSFDFWIS